MGRYIPDGPVISALPTPIKYLSPFVSARAFEEDDFVCAVHSESALSFFAGPLRLAAKNVPSTNRDTMDNMVTPVLRGARDR